MRALILAAILMASPGPVQEAAPPVPIRAAAREVARFPAEEAKQGVAVDARYFYAMGNDRIGKYDKATGRRVAHWEGGAALYPHTNSCVVDGALLVCAASNHPSVPMASAVEFFDTATLRHVRSVALPPMPGSLTWIERRGKTWFAGFANYDPPAHGGEPGHDHRWTLVLELDAAFRPLRSWRFPEDVLAAFAPMSNSGGSWGPGGLLYVTGHDRPELYAMRLPEAGTVLEHVATIPLSTGGQAFAWDRTVRGKLWSVDRKTRSVVASLVALP